MSKTEDAEFFLIDKDRLDEEWINQPKLYHHYAMKLHHAKEDMELRKTALELAYSELDSDIRERPSRYGFEAKAPTETAIKNTITQHKSYQKPLASLNNARASVGMLQVAVSTLDHRKKALENLVDLRLADYWSEPRTRPQSADAIAKSNKRAARKAQEPEDA